MTESFIMNAFHKMGEQPQTVKVMRNRYTGEPAGYCFVHFPTDEMALDAMHKLNGKVIPGSNPVRIYKVLIKSLFIIYYIKLILCYINNIDISFNFYFFYIIGCEISIKSC